MPLYVKWMRAHAGPDAHSIALHCTHAYLRLHHLVFPLPYIKLKLHRQARKQIGWVS